MVGLPKLDWFSFQAYDDGAVIGCASHYALGDLEKI